MKDLAMVFHLLLSSLTFVLSAHAQIINGLVGRAPQGSNTVIVQMFEWSWESIASECTSFLGPAGYGFVQGSPPAEHVTGPQWWTDYQPVSYTLTSKRGTRDQFQSMINACHSAGVKVIADTIWNHMAGSDNGTGVAGSSFTHYVYPGIYQFQDFHHCGLEPGDEIVNYFNRLEVQTCQLDNLADLGTDTEYVRGRLAEYGNDLLSLGVDGFRLDASKHIAATDIANITSRLTSMPYITQEVIFGAGQPITPNEYVGNGDVQEFRYTTAVHNAFSGNAAFSSLEDLDNQGWVSGSSANVFVANHDTERNGASLNYNSPSNTYVLATIFSLAHSFGTPTVLSSYSFSTTDDGAPNGGTGTCSDHGGTNGWLCQHRWPAVAGMVTFHNAVSGDVTNFISTGSQQIAFGRGTTGFVVINNQDTPWSTTFTSSLPAGTYCDVVAGPASNGVCAGSSYAVSTSGTFTATVSARNALALHVQAMSTSGSVTLNFAENATTTFGDNIFLVGSISQLGAWDTNAALPLSAAKYPLWTVSISLPASTNFQYKFIRKTAAGGIVWESDPNRSDTTPSTGTQTLDSSWR